MYSILLNVAYRIRSDINYITYLRFTRVYNNFLCTKFCYCKMTLKI